MKIIDARNQSCPKPVIMTKNALEEGADNLTIVVDNNIAKANVVKFFNKSGYDSTIKEENDDIYISIIRSNEVEKIKDKKEENKNDTVYVIGKDVLGDGSKELGIILMKGFIYTLTEIKPYPKALVFLNSGINLTTDGSESIADLKKLKDNGVKILSCGTCLDYYEKKDELLVGEISNMYDIVETISDANNTISF